MLLTYLMCESIVCGLYTWGVYPSQIICRYSKLDPICPDRWSPPARETVQDFANLHDTFRDSLNYANSLNPAIQTFNKVARETANTPIRFEAALYDLDAHRPVTDLPSMIDELQNLAYTQYLAIDDAQARAKSSHSQLNITLDHLQPLILSAKEKTYQARRSRSAEIADLLAAQLDSMTTDMLDELTISVRVVQTAMPRFSKAYRTTKAALEHTLDRLYQKYQSCVEYGLPFPHDDLLRSLQKISLPELDLLPTETLFLKWHKELTRIEQERKILRKRIKYPWIEFDDEAISILLDCLAGPEEEEEEVVVVVKGNQEGVKEDGNVSSSLLTRVSNGVWSTLRLGR
ncbi:MAG: hypothetical protein Q9227_002741 [Pyrenula ochraceoflavens]